MYLCSDCRNNVCEDHIHFGSGGVRVAINGMSALTLDRPLLLFPGEEVGQADHPAKVGAEAVIMDLLHFHRQDLASRRRPRSRWASGGPSGGASTGGYPGGAENNQCGSSFYGPAFGGGVYNQGVGAGVSQQSVAPGCEHWACQ